MKMKLFSFSLVLFGVWTILHFIPSWGGRIYEAIECLLAASSLVDLCHPFVSTKLTFELLINMGNITRLLYGQTWVNFVLRCVFSLLIFEELWWFCYWKIKKLPVEWFKSDLNSILCFVVFMNMVLSFFSL